MKDRLFSWTYLAAALVLLLALVLVSCPDPVAPPPQEPEPRVTGFTPSMNRGVLAAASSEGVFLSWELRLNDPPDVGFNVYRSGFKLNDEILGPAHTNFFLPGAASGNYQVEVLHGEVSQGFSESAWLWTDDYYRIPLQKPPSNRWFHNNGNPYTGEYHAYDMVPFAYGNGDFDLFMFWVPHNEADPGVAQPTGGTGNVFIDAYTLDGTKIWGSGKWIDLGVNITATNHSQGMAVADFMGAGYPQIMVKTAPLTIDAACKVLGPIDADGNIRYWTRGSDGIIRDEDGETVNLATHRYVNSSHYITAGEEYLSLFDGRTGELIDTIWYPVPRNMMQYQFPASASQYGVQGNRTNRFNTCVAHLRGPSQNPSGIFQRGYYSENSFTISAVDATSDGKLEVYWILSCSPYSQHGAPRTGPYTIQNIGMTSSAAYASSNGPFSGQNLGPYADKAVYPGGANASVANGGSGINIRNQGNHWITVASVKDGTDQIFTGAAAFNSDGTVMWSATLPSGSRFGHGDAMHLARHNPERPGLQMFSVWEGTGGMSLLDAQDGSVIWDRRVSGDNGRGLAAPLDPDRVGNVFWSWNVGLTDSAGTSIASVANSPDMVNFAIWWDGSTRRNLLDGGNLIDPRIERWTLTGNTAVGELIRDFPGARTNAGTKQVPMIQADLFGDWREELIFRDTDSTELRIYTSTLPTVHDGPYAVPVTGIPTLRDSHQYWMQVLSQQATYNQPPWPEWYIGHGMDDIRE